MAFFNLTSAKILADSTYRNGTRLVTVEAVFPRCILSEVNTHKDLSRNSASSRAIPVQKQIQRVIDQPFVPARFPINRPGMSADEYWEPGTEEYESAAHSWLYARDKAVDAASALVTLGVHKQIANRLIEPFMHHTAILSATMNGWEHIFSLRCHPAAQPEFRTLAEKIRTAIQFSVPRMLEWNQWHLPLIGFSGDEDLSLADQIRVSIGRVARVSYLTHDGQRDIQADLDLFAKLKNPGDSPPHASPAEHQATPSHNPSYCANFRGWMQARKFIELGAAFPQETVSTRA